MPDSVRPTPTSHSTARAMTPRAMKPRITTPAPSGTPPIAASITITTVSPAATSGPAAISLH